MIKKFKNIGTFFLIGLLWISIAKAEDFCTAYPQYLRPAEWQAIGGTAAPNYYSSNMNWAWMHGGWYPELSKNSTNYAYTVLQGPSNGSIVAQNNKITYVPNPGYSGYDKFTYKYQAGSVDSNIGTISINVVPSPGHPPVAHDQNVFVPFNKTKVIFLSASNFLNTELEYTISQQPAHGQISYEPPYISYSPDTGYMGVDEIQFQVSDGTNISNPGTVSITVLPTPTNRPIAGNQNMPAAIDHSVEIDLSLIYETGGLPQLTDIDSWRLRLDVVIRGTIPNPQFDGYYIFDQESWWPIWSLTETHYREESKKHVRAIQPSWTEEQIDNEAKRIYENGAKFIFLETLRRSKELRPLAHFGYYAYPFVQYWCGAECGPSWVGISQRYRDLNDSLGWLWQWLRDNSGVLSPSIYQHYTTSSQPHVRANNERFVRESIKENKRISDQYNEIPIFPWVWSRYHPYHTNPCPVCVLEDPDMDIMLRIPFEEGAAGLFHYIWPADPEPDYTNHVTPILSPIIRDICAIDYTIVADGTEGGLVNPPGTQSYDIGSSPLYSFLPNPGFQIQDVRVDGKSVGNAGQFVFKNLRSNHALAAQFAQIGNADGFGQFPKVFNPARGETVTIEYLLSKPSQIELTIYSRIGRKIITLINEFKNAGTQAVSWDGNNDEGKRVASGTYNLILKIDNDTSHTQKIVVIK